MRFLPRALVACGTGFAVSLLAACGSTNGLLSGDQSNALSNQLDQVGSAANAGDCGAASSASRTFNNAVVNLPGTVNRTLRADLLQGGSTVGQLAARDCQKATTTSTSTPTSTSTSTSTSSTPTTTSSTSSTSTTTPTTTTSTTPTTTTETTTTTTSSTSTTSSGGGGLAGGGNSGGGNGQGNNG